MARWCRMVVGHATLEDLTGAGPVGDRLPWPAEWAERCAAAERKHAELLRELAVWKARVGEAVTLPALNGAQTERVAWAIEACARAQEAAAVVLTRGYGALHPVGSKLPTRNLLERELGAVLAAVEALCAEGDLRKRVVLSYRDRAVDRRRAPQPPAGDAGKGTGTGQ